MAEMTIGPGTQVTLHFAVKLADGSVVDSTFDKEPATFVVGDKNFLEGFESLLLGLPVGAKDSFQVLPEQGFGQPNPNNVQEIPRTAFAEDMELAEGLLVSFADAADNELPGMVQAVSDTTVVVDFNHPLAGRNLIFDVEILDIQPAITH